MILFFISGILAGGLRSAVCLFLIFRLLPVKENGGDDRSGPQDTRLLRNGMITVTAGGMAISGLLFWAGLPDFCRMALEAVWISICARRWLKTDARMSLFVGVFYEIGVSFWQFLLMAGMGILFCLPELPDQESMAGQGAIWLIHLFLAGGAAVLSRKQDVDGKAAFRGVSFASVAGFIAVITLSEQTALALTDDLLTMWTVLAVVLMMSVLVFALNRQYEMEKELADLKSQQAQLLERDYTRLSQAYAVNAKLFHDFHNHIGVLRQFLSRGKYTEAVQYLDELQSPVREMADTIWTGDETADYLINSKAAAAASLGIRLQAAVEFPRHTNIKSADLCAILGNFLDNALEAAKQVTEPEQRIIRLTIRRINQMLVIKVENAFTVLPVQGSGGLETTKTEGGLHGWGLKSARTAAEKYDGMVQTTFTDGMFRAVATLSFNGVET